MDEREEAFARGACRAVSALFAGIMIGTVIVAANMEDKGWTAAIIAISAALAGLFLAAAVVKAPEPEE